MFSARRFYDELSADYHLIYADWDAGIARQAAALDGLLGPRRRTVLDCACGIGTQAIGLAARGHRVTGSDLGPLAAARGVHLAVAAADMRALPFRAGVFDAVVCADNSLPHLLTAADVRAALGELRRVLRPGGRLIISTRPYDEFRRTRPRSAPPQVAHRDGGRTITFQLWHWHDDGERYDVEHFQLRPGEDGSWTVRTRHATYWELTERELSGFVASAGFTGIGWHQPADTGFFQPVLAATATG